MQGRPALVVRLVHSGALLHQEAHHLQVLINAGLGVGNSRQPHLRQPRCPSKAGLQRQPRKQIQGHGARTVGKTTPTASGRQLFKIPPIAQWSGPPSLRRSVETTKGLPATCKQEVSGEGRGLLIRVRTPHGTCQTQQNPRPPAGGASRAATREEVPAPPPSEPGVLAPSPSCLTLSQVLPRVKPRNHPGRHCAGAKPRPRAVQGGGRPPRAGHTQRAGQDSQMTAAHLCVRAPGCHTPVH